MAQVKCTLPDGLKLTREGGAEKVLRDVVLREATAGDVIDASEESERVVVTPEGYQLLLSPARLGAEVLRRQIVSIGDVQGPISLAELKRLSPRDLDLLQKETQKLEAAAGKSAARAIATTEGTKAAEALAERGRGGGAAD